MPETKILVFAGSTRSGALSGKLAAVAAREIALLDTEVTLISLADYPLPIYDADAEAAAGVPDNALKLARLIATHDGVFVATPEYNHSPPPLLVNVIDWISRIAPKSGVAYRDRIYALGGTSDGPIGGARAVADLRKLVAAGLGGLVIPDQVPVPYSQNAFDEAGRLIDANASTLLRRTCDRLVDHARRTAARA